MFEDSQQKHEISEIIDQKIVKSMPHFLVKWKGKPQQFNTWEPITRLENNREILKFWLISKRRKCSKPKERQKRVNLNQQQVYNQSLSQKLAISHKRVEHNQLKTKKPELNYLSNVKNCISLISDDEQEDQSGQEFERWSITKPQQAKIARKTKPSSMKVGKTLNEQINFIKSKVNTEKIQAKPKETFRVIAAVDPSKIVRICKLFTFRQTKCVQVQYQDGRHMNMKEQDVKRTNPMLLMEYYEMMDIPI